MARKEYAYNLYDREGKAAFRDKTRPELLLLFGMDINLGNCMRGGLLQGKYRMESCREFSRENSLDDRMLAEFESVCRKFRKSYEWRGEDV